MTMRVLVTGGFGNIGRSTVEALLARGHDVRVLSRRRADHARWAARRGRRLEARWGDICRPEDVRLAVSGCDTIVHLAAVLPPDSDDQPERAHEVNVGGTRKLVDAAKDLRPAPRFLFASSFDVFGPTQHLPPPRRASDPVQATDAYSAHKIAGEERVRSSGLRWSILRFADVPRIALREPHPIMFEIPLDTRIETLHTRDAGLAVASALDCDRAWENVMLVGGGPRCQVTFREYVRKMLAAMGVGGPLPEKAFGTRPYSTDWLDTEESERLLRYQRHSFDDIVGEIAALLGPRRLVVPLLRPWIRRRILKLSPYWRTSGMPLRT